MPSSGRTPLGRLRSRGGDAFCHGTGQVNAVPAPRPRRPSVPLVLSPGGRAGRRAHDDFRPPTLHSSLLPSSYTARMRAYRLPLPILLPVAEPKEVSPGSSHSRPARERRPSGFCSLATYATCPLPPQGNRCQFPSPSATSATMNNSSAYLLSLTFSMLSVPLAWKSIASCRTIML